MDLELMRDFEAVADRWDEFWRGESPTPLIATSVLKPGSTPVEKPGYAVGTEGDLDPIVDQLLAWAETQDFLGAAVPFFYLEFAADHFASLLGADMTFSDHAKGGWITPFLDDIDNADIRFEREGRWWKQTVEFAQALRAKCDGKLLIASNTLVADLDALAAIRSPQKLLVDMLDKPDAVHRALRQITAAHGEILDALSDLLDFPTYGSITRHGMYARGRVNVPQSDFSCMISRDMFREFCLPYLREEMQRLDAAEYHLDGPGAIQHLEAVCEIEELGVIQWQPGAGEAETQDWTQLYDRIDSLGKGQIRLCKPDEAVRIAERTRDKRLFLALDVQSRAEFEDCVARIEALD